jgi:hypothetical protein
VEAADHLLKTNNPHRVFNGTALSRDKFTQHLPVHIRQPTIDTVVAIRQPCMVNAEQMEHRRV